MFIRKVQTVCSLFSSILLFLPCYFGFDANQDGCVYPDLVFLSNGLSKCLSAEKYSQLSMEQGKNGEKYLVAKLNPNAVVAGIRLECKRYDFTMQRVFGTWNDDSHDCNIKKSDFSATCTGPEFSSDIKVEIQPVRNVTMEQNGCMMDIFFVTKPPVSFQDIDFPYKTKQVAMRAIDDDERTMVKGPISNKEYVTLHINNSASIRAVKLIVSSDTVASLTLEIGSGKSTPKPCGDFTYNQTGRGSRETPSKIMIVCGKAVDGDRVILRSQVQRTFTVSLYEAKVFLEKATFCRNLKDPETGNIVYTEDNFGKRTADIVCDPKYEKVPTASRSVCSSNGTWSVSHLRCTRSPQISRSTVLIIGLVIGGLVVLLIVLIVVIVCLYRKKMRKRNRRETIDTFHFTGGFQRPQLSNAKPDVVTTDVGDTNSHQYHEYVTLGSDDNTLQTNHYYNRLLSMQSGSTEQTAMTEIDLNDDDDSSVPVRVARV